MDVLLQQLDKQKQCYEEKLEVKEQQNTQLRLERDSLRAQRERDAEMMGRFEERLRSMEASLARKTELINRCFKERAAQ